MTPFAERVSRTYGFRPPGRPGPTTLLPDEASQNEVTKPQARAAVLTQLADLYRDGHLIEKALADVARHTETERPRLEEQLAATRADISRLEAKLERYFEAFENGHLSAELCQERIRAHRARLATLREQEADLTHSLGTQAHTAPDPAVLTGLADQLDEILASQSPEQAKELLRLLVKEIQVHDRRRIIPTYRIPAAVRTTPPKVGGTGLEPVTPSLSIRAPPLRVFAAAHPFSRLCRSFVLEVAAALALVCALFHRLVVAPGGTNEHKHAARRTSLVGLSRAKVERSGDPAPLDVVNRRPSRPRRSSRL